MADDTTTKPDTGATTDDTSKDSTTGTDTGKKPDTDAKPDDTSSEVDKWKALARKHEAEAREGKKALDKLKQLEDAGKSELEKAQQRAADADAKIKEANERADRAAVKAHLTNASAKAGAIDIDAVEALIDRSTITVEGDTVTGVDGAVEALKKIKPHLFGKPKPPAGSADGGQQGGAQPGQWTRDDLKGKSSAEIEAARKAGLLTNLMQSTS